MQLVVSNPSTVYNKICTYHCLLPSSVLHRTSLGLDSYHQFSSHPLLLPAVLVFLDSSAVTPETTWPAHFGMRHVS